MKVSEAGEFGLIEIITGIIDKTNDVKNTHQLLVGIGDDAAVWQSDSSVQLATTDSLIQDTHFDLSITTWEKAGWKALATNLSDIAAMGGTPQYALVSLALPGDIEVDSISSLYQGIIQIANKYEVAIAGGNVASSDKVMINITVLGSLKNSDALTRSAAKAGEQIAITGYTGLSAAGLRMLKQNIKLDAKTSKLFKDAHLKPVPKIKEGQILLHQGVRSAIDISDGLLADLAHICKASQVSAGISQSLVPIHPSLQSYFEADCQQLALTGGEDYELLFTASNQVIEKVKRSMSCPVTIIGEIIGGSQGQVTLTDATNESLRLQQAGWDHFKQQA